MRMETVVRREQTVMSKALLCLLGPDEVRVNLWNISYVVHIAYDILHLSHDGSVYRKQL